MVGIKLVGIENAFLVKRCQCLPQCATGNPVSVPVDRVDFFRSGSGPVSAKYRPDRPDLTKSRNK